MGCDFEESIAKSPTSGMGQGHTLRPQTQFLAGYLASKHYGMWSEGKFKSRDSALRSTISSDLRDVVTGVLFSNSSLSSIPTATLSGPLEMGGF